MRASSRSTSSTPAAGGGSAGSWQWTHYDERKGSNGQMALKAGEEAPDFELRSHRGGTVRLSDFRGRKNVIVAFHPLALDRKSTRLNSSHLVSSYAVFCLKKEHPTSHAT